MDLLFKRYASPFDYLDVLLAYGNFYNGICNILDSVNEDKNWEFYLSNNPYNKVSYEDFKREQKQKQQAHTKMSKTQVVATVNKSQEILKNFNPLKQDKDNKE